MVGMFKRFRYLRDDVREHLKKKLPAYAVPSVLDKPALPFPEPQQLAAAGGEGHRNLARFLLLARSLLLRSGPN